MYQRILVPVDLADPNLAKPALETAVMIAKASDGEHPARSTCCR